MVSTPTATVRRWTVRRQGEVECRIGLEIYIGKEWMESSLKIRKVTQVQDTFDKLTSHLLLRTLDSMALAR